MKVIIGNVSNNTTPTFQPSHQTVNELKPQKYNLNIDNYIGDVDFFGVLYDPTESGVLDMSDVYSIPSQTIPGSAFYVGLLEKAFCGNTGLHSASIGADTFGKNALKECFAETNIEEVYFNRVTTTTFSNYETDRFFMDMLEGCSNVTVHFPASIQSTVQSLSDFVNGFGGTNTNIVYDL